MRRVPLDADEKTTLAVALDRHRDVVVWKLEGLDEEEARRPRVPSGTSLLGLVKHLTWVEYGWFCDTFGHPNPLPPFDEDDPDADLRVEPGETITGVLAGYARARAAADAVIREHDVADTGTAWHGTTVTLRWVLVHMVEETARHVGHLDILRELTDGATGAHPEVRP
jgi:uncharacterized damage-inducible protein DinB